MRGKKTSIIRTILIIMVIGFSCQITQAQDKNDCQQIINDIFQDPNKVPPLVYLNSGKFINDLGDYNNCIYHQKDGYSYTTLRVVTKGIGFQYMGFCLPNQCTQQLISNQYSKDIQTQLNDIYKEQSNKDNDVFFNLYFYNPKTQYPQADWSNYLVIFIVLGLVLLGVIASVISKITKNQSLPIKAIKCFSLYDNLKKIIIVPKTTQNQNLLFLNGTRVLSIFWIVFGHDMWFRFMNIKNWMQTINILTTPGIPTLTGAAYFAVDTFLWLGAFLVTLGLLQQLKKVRNYTTFYFFSLLHRFVRVWPTYLIAILIFWKIAPLFGNGPIWNTYQIFSNKCSNFGALWNLLFIDNFMDHGPNGMDYCFGWGWYLAVDFQLFLIAPFIMMIYTKNKKIGVIVTCFLLFASVLTAFVMVFVNDWRYPIPNPKFAPQPQFMDKFYYKPYIRASAYMMGCLTGFLYFQWKNQNESVVRIINRIKNSIAIRLLFYIIGITLVQGTIWIITPYQTGQSEWSTTGQALYNSLNRIVFLFGMFLCVFAAMFGCKNDPSKFILSHPVFSPLAKVSFCIYLTHFIVVMDGTFSVRMDLYWQPMSSIYVVICDIFWATILATCLSVMIQSPILGLEKILLRPAKKGSKKSAQSDSTPQMKIQFKEDNSLKNSMIESNDSVQYTYNNSDEYKRKTINLQ